MKNLDQHQIAEFWIKNKSVVDLNFNEVQTTTLRSTRRSEPPQEIFASFVSAAA